MSQPTPQSIAYLGPEATFTEQAVDGFFPAASGRRVPCESVSAAFDRVRDRSANAAVVPLENSVEGGVSSTLAELADGPPVAVTGEVLVPVEFALLVRPDTPWESVRRVGTHPHAAGQCRHWLRSHLPSAQVVSVSSTAAAAEAVARGDAGLDAALAARPAALRYGLESLAEGIADRRDAVTRFVRVEPPGRRLPVSGADVTSILVLIRDDHPGALLEVLEAFASRGVNLTRIESRPTGTGLGRYCFFIDALGHVSEPAVGEALMALPRSGAAVRLLGSYPRAVQPRSSTVGRPSHAHRRAHG